MVDNSFYEHDTNRVTINQDAHISIKKYHDVERIGHGEPLRILFLCSDSAFRIKGAVSAQARKCAEGLLNNHRKNVKELPETTPDEHFMVSLVKSYKAGGERALSVMLSLAEEEHAIQAACDVNGNVLLEKYFNVRVEEVSLRIKQNRPDVFHFSGHSRKNEGLAFCSPVQSTAGGFRTDYMSQESLMSSFQNKKVFLVILASCDSAEYAKALVESNLAKIAIGSSASVYDSEVIKFVERFYCELFKQGKLPDKELMNSIQKAFALAMRAVDTRRCPMRIYPEIKSVLPIRNLSSNRIDMVDSMWPSPLTKVERKFNNTYKAAQYAPHNLNMVEGE